MKVEAIAVATLALLAAIANRLKEKALARIFELVMILIDSRTIANYFLP